MDSKSKVIVNVPATPSKAPANPQPVPQSKPAIVTQSKPAIVVPTPTVQNAKVAVVTPSPTVNEPVAKVAAVSKVTPDGKTVPNNPDVTLKIDAPQTRPGARERGPMVSAPQQKHFVEGPINPGSDLKPGRKLFRVRLQDNPEALVEVSGDRMDAIEAYNKEFGIISTIHKHEISEATE